MASSSRFTQLDLQILAAGIERIAPFDKSDLPLLESVGRIRELKRGEHLLSAGEDATQAGLLMSGLLREYFVMSTGIERTKAFVQAGENTGSFANLLSNQPSRAFIVAEEPSRVALFDYATMRALANERPSWMQWQLFMTERMFASKAEREYELLGLDAAARYASCMKRYPGLEARVAARHIASYLGITAVHLSRLRRKQRDERRKLVPSPATRS